MTTISLRLPDEIHRRLRTLAEKTRRTKTSFIKEMIESCLPEYEDAYEALDRLNEKKARYLKSGELIRRSL